MKRRRMLSLISLGLLSGFSGCLSYFNESEEGNKYPSSVEEGDNITISNSTIKDNNLIIDIENNLDVEERASLKVTYYNSDDEIIGYPNVYSSDPIPSGGKTTFNISVEDINNISRYEIEAIMNK